MNENFTCGRQPALSPPKLAPAVRGIHPEADLERALVEKLKQFNPRGKATFCGTGIARLKKNRS